MIDIIAIPSVIYLVLMTSQVDFGPAGVGDRMDTKIVIQEMPSMHMCESVGEWIKNARTNLATTYTCIEGPRDE